MHVDLWGSRVVNVEDTMRILPAVLVCCTWCTERVDVGLVLLWPYLCGSEDAPATAKRGDAKKVRSAASMSASRVWPRVTGIRLDDRMRLRRCAVCDKGEEVKGILSIVLNRGSQVTSSVNLVSTTTSSVLLSTIRLLVSLPKHARHSSTLIHAPDWLCLPH